jgi:hypothetical protein
MRKFIGWIVLLAGSWLLVAPRALLGLKELQWMHACSFRGDVPLGIVTVAVAYCLLDLKPRRTAGQW